MLRWAKAAAARLGELDNDDDKIAALARGRGGLAAEVAELAGQLTAARTQTAARFAEAVTAELTALAMPHARLSVAVTPRHRVRARMAPTRWRSGWRRTPAPRRCRWPRARRAASCRG